MNRANTALVLKNIPKQVIKLNSASSLIAPLNLLYFGTWTVHWRSEPQGFGGRGRGHVCEGKCPDAVSLNIHDLRRRINQACSLHVTNITEEISSFAARDQ